MPSVELGIATLPSEKNRRSYQCFGSNDTRFIDNMEANFKNLVRPISKINFELLLIYNFTVNKYHLACKENKPKVLLALEKQIGGRNPATFTVLCVLCRSLSTSPVSCCQQGEIADTSKTT